MKLWFKIFISSLFLVIAAINITSMLILSDSHSLMISRERRRALSYHEFICSSIQNNITYERLRSDVFMLSEEDTDKIIEKVILSRLDENSPAIVYKNNKPVFYGDVYADISTLYESLNKEDDTGSIIVDFDEKTYIFVGSISRFEEQTYTIFTANDISEIYLEHNRQLQFVRMISFVFAGLTAVVLLIMIKIFLRPLDTVNSSINKIASGDYSRRLEIKGSKEFCILSENINTMAESIEENYHKIEMIADERKHFIDSLSHEIKTPLTSILGFADILRIKKKITPEELNEYSSIIVEEAKRLRSLSGKLMELVSSGDSPIELKPTKTDVILNDLKTVFEPIMKTKNLELICDIKSFWIEADADIFKSLIYNFIDNAVKASYENGKIELSCISDKNDDVIITVRDYGIGISKEEQKRVFEPFYMADKSRSRKLGGAGLGLALCAEIAKKHNAVIELESEPKKGTKISVRIKIAEVKSNDKKTP